MSEDFLKQLRKDLISNADSKTKESAKRFSKEKVNVYGVKTAIVTKIAKDYFKDIKDNPKEEIFKLCELLWQSGVMEESFVACNWSYALRRQYGKPDFIIFEKWLSNYVNNWASCDTFCNHTIGDLVEQFPELVSNLKKWTSSKNRWVRRGSAVTLIVPARKGMFLKEIFEIADLLMQDDDDLVQKGYGWLLKVASQTYQKEVFDYVMKNKENMPRTALRYAIEKMPLNLRQRAMSQ